MDWGWQGLYNRVLEFAHIVVDELAPAGRGRLRYNNTIRDFQKSVDGSAWQRVSDNQVVADQTTWYVDSVNGSDDNDGRTASTALEHLSEYFRRARGTLSLEPVLVQLLADNSDPYVISAGDAPGGLTIQGVRTVVATGTLTDVQAYVHTPGSAQRGEISDTSMDFSAHELRRIIMTSGTNVGAWSWIVENLGSNTCVVSPWMGADGWSEVTPAIGDDYEIVTQSTLTGMFANSAIDPFTLKDLKLQGPGSVYPRIHAAYARAGNMSLLGCEVTSPDLATYGKVGGEWGFLAITGCCIHDFLYDHAFQTVFMLVDIYGSVSVGVPWGSDNSHNDSWEFWSAASISAARSTEDVSFKITRNSQLILSAPFGIITPSKANAVTLESTATMTIRSNGVVWSLGGDNGWGISVSAGCSVVWTPTSKTAAEKFEFEGADNDFLFNGTGKTLAEVSTGYVDLAANIGTGEITGSGATLSRNDDTW